MIWAALAEEIVTKYRRYYRLESCVFLTITTHQKRPIFQHPDNIHKLRVAIAQVKAEMPFEIVAAVVLPDHMHFLWQLPEDDWNYSKRVGRMKVFFSKSMGNIGYEPEYLSHSKIKHREKAIWQRRFWESTIKNEKQFENYVNYIHYNPVKHGYVEYPQQWKYSSIHQWIKDGRIPKNWCR